MRVFNVFRVRLASRAPFSKAFFRFTFLLEGFSGPVVAIVVLVASEQPESVISLSAPPPAIVVFVSDGISDANDKSFFSLTAHGLTMTDIGVVVIIVVVVVVDDVDAVGGVDDSNVFIFSSDLFRLLSPTPDDDDDVVCLLADVDGGGGGGEIFNLIDSKLWLIFTSFASPWSFGAATAAAADAAAVAVATFLFCPPVAVVEGLIADIFIRKQPSESVRCILNCVANAILEILWVLLLVLLLLLLLLLLLVV